MDVCTCSPWLLQSLEVKVWAGRVGHDAVLGVVKAAKLHSRPAAEVATHGPYGPKPIVGATLTAVSLAAWLSLPHSWQWPGQHASLFTKVGCRLMQAGLPFNVPAGCIQLSGDLQDPQISVKPGDSGSIEDYLRAFIPNVGSRSPPWRGPPRCLEAWPDFNPETLASCPKS